MDNTFYKMADMMVKSASTEDNVAYLNNPDSWGIFKNVNSENFSELNNNKPYKYNVWVGVCVRAIVRNLICIPKQVYNKRTETVVENHPLIDLFKRPNKDTFGTGIWEKIIVNLLLDGQLFLLPGNKEKLGRGVIPGELTVIQDKYIKPKNENTMAVDGWVYKPNGSDYPYDPEELIRINYYNPYNPHKGLAPLDAAYISLDTYGKMTSYNANFFKNGAALAGVIEIDKSVKTKPGDVEKIKKEFEANHGGEDKAGKTPVFANGMSYKTVSSTHGEMQFKEQYEFSKEEILSAFGVPKNAVGDFADQNYSNAVEANRSFWEDTLLPIDSFINECITYQLVNAMNPDWVLRSDYSGVEAINNIPKEKVDAFEKLVTNGVPRKEAARLLNIPVDWDKVDEEEVDIDAKAKIKADEEVARNAAMKEPKEEDNTDDKTDTENDQKSLRSALNKFFTNLRNKCMDKADKKEDVHFTVDDEYLSLIESLKEVHLPIIKNFIQASKAINGDVNIQPIEIVRLLNGRSKAFADVLTKINDSLTDNKKEIHDLFQDQYGKNKELAKAEIEELYSQIVRI